MGVRAVTAEPGRRIVVERSPVVVEDVTDYVVEDDGTMRLWSHAKPAGDFGPGTYQAVYYAQESGSPLEPQVQAG